MVAQAPRHPGDVDAVARLQGRVAVAQGPHHAGRILHDDKAPGHVVQDGAMNQHLLLLQGLSPIELQVADRLLGRRERIRGRGHRDLEVTERGREEEDTSDLGIVGQPHLADASHHHERADLGVGGGGVRDADGEFAHGGGQGQPQPAAGGLDPVQVAAHLHPLIDLGAGERLFQADDVRAGQRPEALGLEFLAVHGRGEDAIARAAPDGDGRADLRQGETRLVEPHQYTAGIVVEVERPLVAVREGHHPAQAHRPAGLGLGGPHQLQLAHLREGA